MPSEELHRDRETRLDRHNTAVVLIGDASAFSIVRSFRPTPKRTCPMSISSPPTSSANWKDVLASPSSARVAVLGSASLRSRSSKNSGPNLSADGTVEGPRHEATALACARPPWSEPSPSPLGLASERVCSGGSDGPSAFCAEGGGCDVPESAAASSVSAAGRVSASARGSTRTAADKANPKLATIAASSPAPRRGR